MIKKLQVKFVFIIMAIMSIVLILIFSSVNFAMWREGQRQSFKIMSGIAKNDGLMTPQINPPLNRLPNIDNRKLPSNMMMPQSVFFVKLNTDNEILEILYDRNFNYTEEEITELVGFVVNKDKTFGTVSHEQFLIEAKPYGKIIVFLDNTTENGIAVRLMWTSIAIGGISLVVIFFIALFLSAWAIKPVKKSFESQKRFVADASHELKTPLTVISANADVLCGEIGENKWLGFIKTEISRMNELTNNLLYLAKTDSDENVYNFKEFDLSKAVMTACLPFESIAFESENNLTLEIAKNIYLQGDESRIKQAVIILLDNAIKNSDKAGEIKICLKMQSNKKIITVFNTGDEIPDDEKTKIFERFYRSDSSRARETGGYGLGLSIAKTIVCAHKGKMWVESEKGKGVTFIVML